MDPAMMAEPRIVYTNLCRIGVRMQGKIDRDVAETRRIAVLLLNAEDHLYTNIPRYRDELAKTRARLNQGRIELGRHVGHCNDGCQRSEGQTGSVMTYDRAPSHAKPPLPPMAVIAARLRNGEALQPIAAEYDRNPRTLAGHLNAAGFNSGTGQPTTRPETGRRLGWTPLPAPDPGAWKADALCAQTDPEAFYPEKGGSTKAAEAKAREVRQQCLEEALERGERYGVWGGLPDRERRRLARRGTTQSPATVASTPAAAGPTPEGTAA